VQPHPYRMVDKTRPPWLNALSPKLLVEEIFTHKERAYHILLDWLVYRVETF
jgi:hypothetical protein